MIVLDLVALGHNMWLYIGHCAADVGGDTSAYCLYGFLTFLIYFVIFQLRTLTVKYSVLLVNRHMLVTHETDGIVLSENYIIYIQVCLLFHIKSSTFICMRVLFLQKKKQKKHVYI